MFTITITWHLIMTIVINLAMIGLGMIIGVVVLVLFSLSLFRLLFGLYMVV